MPLFQAALLKNVYFRYDKHLQLKMAQITGKYQLEKNENLDGYFKAVGE